MTDKVQARKLVLVSAFLLAAIALYKDHGQGSKYKALWAVGVVSLVLSIVADFAPTVAGPFAGLVVLGSLISGDVSLIDRMLGGAGKAPAPAAKPNAAAAAKPRAG